MSREQSSRVNSSSTRGRGLGPKPDSGNRFYNQVSEGRRNRFTPKPAPDSPPGPDIKEGLDTSKIIKTISAPARLAAPEIFPIDNVEYVASYNWIDAENPTMVVPGAVHV